MDNKALNCASSSLRHLCSFWNQNKLCWKCCWKRLNQQSCPLLWWGAEELVKVWWLCQPLLAVKQTHFRELQVFQAPVLWEGSTVSLREGLHCQPFTGVPGVLVLGFKKQKCLRWQAVGWGDELCLPGESLAYLRFGLCLKSYCCLMGNWKNISFQKQYCALSSICSCPLSVFIKCWLWDSWRDQILWFLNRQKVEFSLTDACWIGLWRFMQHLSPGLTAPGSSVCMNSRDLLGIMSEWGMDIRSDCSALKSALHGL